MSRCRSCNAEVSWLRTTKGNSMPLDVQPTDEGNIVIVNGVAHVFSGAVALAEYAAAGHISTDMPRYTSHFATCPEASSWRKKR